MVDRVVARDAAFQHTPVDVEDQRQFTPVKTGDRRPCRPVSPGRQGHDRGWIARLIEAHDESMTLPSVDLQP